MEPLPTVGRIVHYHSYGTPGGEFKPLPRAAVVTQINGDGTIGLCAINPTGLFFHERCPRSDDPKPGHWNWPPKV